jgi:hypothetical protein
MGLLTQSQLEDLLRANAKDRTLAQLADLDEETLKEMIAVSSIEPFDRYKFPPQVLNLLPSSIFPSFSFD